MHELYNFNFLDTVSEQLFERLKQVEATPLTADALAELGEFQKTHRSRQGVYVLHKDGVPVYIGKTNNMRARLAKHMKKISGRLNIMPDQISYKCLLLDKNMSTAANETILIRMFQPHNSWNKAGFGPNDPGKERDTTAPSDFDSAHPIRVDFPVPEVNDTETIGSLFKKMKASLPYVFRYQVLPVAIASRTLDLASTDKTAKPLLAAAMATFDHGWRAAVLSYGMVIYHNTKNYPHAQAVIDAP